MKAQLTALVLAAVAVVGLAATAAQAEGGPTNVKSAEEFGIIWAHGNGNATGHGAKPQKGVNLIYHGGLIQTGTTKVYPIFWGSSWDPKTGDKIPGLDSFYQGVGGTPYAATNSEYTNGSGAHVSTDVQYGGGPDKVDNSAAPSNAPSTSQVLQEVAKQYPNPTQGSYYPVYIDQPRGNAGYCAWHSAGTINGVQVQFAFFFNLDNDAGCDPGSPTAEHSQGLWALGNVSGHELSEMLTDPQLNAWYDGTGSENADKCAWTFGSTTITFSNNTHWRVQGNWSNNAYNSNSGYARGGCIDHA